MKITRRGFVQGAGAATAIGMIGTPYIALGASKKVVVVGGGTGGATAAKYLLMADPTIEVTLIEANKHYYTCYMSNEVLGGDRSIDSIKFGYSGLAKQRVNVVHDVVTGIDAKAKVGTHRTLNCIARVKVGDETIIQTNGSGELRIDKPLPPKVDAPKPAAPKPAAKAPAKPKPLSRLEQLRLKK